MIESNIIHSAYKYGTEKLIFLGSSCIYPKLAPQPLKEEYLLSGYLESTNEPYAIDYTYCLLFATIAFSTALINSIFVSNKWGVKKNHVVLWNRQLIKRL